MSAVTVSTREAASLLGVSLRTAQRRAQRGRLDAVKVAGRWLISIEVPALDEFHAWQLDKARELIEAGGLVAADRPGLYIAVSSDGESRYETTRDACSCPAGEKGRRCYHRAGAGLADIVRAA